MSVRLVATFMLLAIGSLHAQHVKFNALRFNDDFSSLANQPDLSWYQKFKYTSLSASPTSYLSQGGEVRYLAQHFTNEDWGDIPVSDYNSFYTRFLYHTDWYINKRLRIFGQLNSTFATGRVTPNRAVDENRFDIQQLFADVAVAHNAWMRVGRQELLYGSQRIISVREGPNNRQSYDAIKIVWQQHNVQLDAYYSHPVRVRQNIFDDRFNDDEKLWSSYAVINNVHLLNNIDLYYIGYSNREKGYASGSAQELRHSIGTRIWHQSRTWSYDFEALYQFGSFGDDQIHAYTASLDLNYTFNDVKLQPTAGFKTEIISGDQDNSDGELNTFNPLFPRGAYFGLAALIGPANLIDFHPTISIKPHALLEISADYDVFWRYSTNDGIYGPNVVLIYGSNSPASFIGHQVGLAAEYKPNPFMKLTPEVMWFVPGGYLKDLSPGKEVLFAAFTAQFKF